MEAAGVVEVERENGRDRVNLMCGTPWLGQGFKYPSRSLAVTFLKAKKRLYSAIALANPFSCFANQVHSFRISSTSSIHHVEKQHRTSTSCFHKSNTKFR